MVLETSTLPTELYPCERILLYLIFSHLSRDFCKINRKEGKIAEVKREKDRSDREKVKAQRETIKKERITHRADSLFLGKIIPPELLSR